MLITACQSPHVNNRMAAGGRWSKATSPPQELEVWAEKRPTHRLKKVRMVLSLAILPLPYPCRLGDGGRNKPITQLFFMERLPLVISYRGTFKKLFAKPLFAHNFPFAKS
jgi:hypothetical protein